MKNTSILKVAYLAGAVADFTVGLLMITYPSICLKLYGFNITQSPEVRFWVAYAGVPILAWTAFFIWGLRRPGERKFVAVPTILVVLCFVMVQIAGIFNGTLPTVNMLPLLAMQLVLVALFLMGYRRA
jgi:hypothetical protein